MTDIIAEYQKWKQQGQDLRAQAKGAMEARFRELLTEAAQVAEEYRTDFGAPIKPPPVVTSFRYKAPAKGKPKAGTKAKRDAKPQAAAPPPAPSKPDPKIAALEKKLAAARKKLEAAKTAGSPTKNLEDRIYEIEDDLRLASSK